MRPLDAGTGVEWGLVGVAGRSQSPLGMVGAGSLLALEMAHHGAPFWICRVSCMGLQPQAFLKNVPINKVINYLQ